MTSFFTVASSSRASKPHKAMPYSRPMPNRGPPTQGLFGGAPQNVPNCANVASYTMYKARFAKSDSCSPSIPADVGVVAHHSYDVPVEAPRQLNNRQSPFLSKRMAQAEKEQSSELMKHSGMPQENCRTATKQQDIICPNKLQNMLSTPSSSQCPPEQSEYDFARNIIDKRIKELEASKLKMDQELEKVKQERTLVQQERELVCRERQEALQIKCTLASELQEVHQMKDQLALQIQQLGHRESQMLELMRQKIVSLEERLAMQEEKLTIQDIEWNNALDDKVAQIMQGHKLQLRAEFSAQLAAHKQHLSDKMKASWTPPHKDRYKEKPSYKANRDAQKMMNKVASQMIVWEGRMDDMRNSMMKEWNTMKQACNAMDQGRECYSDILGAPVHMSSENIAVGLTRQTISDPALHSSTSNAIAFQPQNVPPPAATMGFTRAQEDLQSFTDLKPAPNNGQEPIQFTATGANSSPADSVKERRKKTDLSWISDCYKFKNLGNLSDRLRTTVNAHSILGRTNVVNSKRPGLPEIDEDAEYDEAVDKAEMKFMNSKMRRIKIGKSRRRVTFKEADEVFIIPNRTQLKEMEDAAIAAEEQAAVRAEASAATVTPPPTVVDDDDDEDL